MGAEPSGKDVRFRVWAPGRQKVEVVLETRSEVWPLRPRAGGYFEGEAREARPGDLYRFLLDGQGPFPDPCSRFQPMGPHGPSEVVDPAFPWTDAAWPGLSSLKGQAIYELHVGSFTHEGTFDGARRRLPYLKDLGVTAIEIMPVHDWVGRWNWGYDGVDLFAPAHAYGRPPSFKRFVNEAHRHGIGVILDVVYNHTGPDGCYLNEFGRDYFSRRYKTDWGPAFNFDCGAARHLILQNACYWIAEYHMDGLRLDATQNIYDRRRTHILAELTRRARRAAGSRGVVLIGENEPQDVRCLTPVEKGGFGMDAVWNDDFHHSARVAMTGFREAYFTDYEGRPQELVSAAKHGYLFQGQMYQWQNKNRGTSCLRLPGESFVAYLQNHDQVANQISGRRLHRLTSAGKTRAFTAYLILSPSTPMLFMGQEFGASSPFLFFCDPKPDLARTVKEGRAKSLAQFPSYASPQAQAKVQDPTLESTFRKTRLDWEEAGGPLLRLHRDLLRLRKRDAVINTLEPGATDGAVLGPETFMLRFETPAGARLLVVNGGPRRVFDPCPEPLLAPPARRRWRLLWSSDEKKYGGPGAVDALQRGGRWVFPKECALFYEPVPLHRV